MIMGRVTNRYLREIAGGPGAAMPTSSQNNTALGLPADPNKKGTKKDISRSSIASTGDSMQEQIITSPEQSFQNIIEELKVGDGIVKRKYMGTQRGRTATGKRAHAIEVNPVMTTKKENNRTIPGNGKRPS